MTEKALATGNEVSESMSRMRIEIVDATSKIGTAAPELKNTAEAFQTEMLDTVARFESRIGGEAGVENALLSVDILYRPVAPGAQIPSALRIYDIFRNYGIYLQSALASYDDEGVREHEMTLFQPVVFEFDYATVSDNFRDVVTALKLALFTNNTRPFTRPQIVALTKVLDRLKKSVDVSEPMMDEIIALMTEHFNLAWPIAEAEINE